MLIFFALGIEPHSDVTVYYSEAEAALHGAIPLVGIHTAYGPLFDEITAVAIACWHSPAALVFLAILVELCSFPVWLKVAREAFTERATRRAAVLYTLNPLAISTVAIGGQNHVGISLLLALSLLALLRNREGWSGLSLGFSIIAVKFLSLLFAPVIFLAARHRVKWTISFLIFPIAG
jgi:Gpi18-like mannosyltransferase